MFTLLRRASLLAFVFLAAALPLLAEDGDEHLVMGNPSVATADPDRPNNYLVKKRQYVLSYNNAKGTPNWVSWRLSKAWLGKTRRGNPFAPDLALPAGFNAVRPNDYRGSGLDRGHVCPAADRSVSKEDMDATFLMSNMMPQAPDLNRITWEKLEAYCRDQVRDGDHDLYIVAGPAGQGGKGTEGDRTSLRGARGKIVVPSKCWKVVLVLPAGSADPKMVTAEAARVFSVVMPNVQGLDRDWREFAVPVKDVQELTGFKFFTTLPPAVAEQLRSRKPETRARPKASPPGATEDKPPKKDEGAGLELSEFKAGCVIGNRKSKIFHVPGGAGYKTAQKSANAVFFKTAKDAEKAGYTRAKR